jgi:hypothetical protein
MSMRGLVVALLCGLLGLGGGALVAYAAQPRPADAGAATPVHAVSPSVPSDVPTVKPYRRDISYPSLSPDLALPVVHRIKNQLATWRYHVPEGWAAYAVCGPGSPCKPGTITDDLIPPRRVNRSDQVRFRPPDEPVVGGYSLRVRILDNTLNDLPMTVATKVVGFQEGVRDFHVIKQTDSSVYFEYRDEPSNYHRFNYFQWFAVPGQTNTTLEMSVSGRQADVPGLRALFNRFADNVSGQ